MTPARITLLPLFALYGCTTPMADIGGLTGDGTGSVTTGPGSTDGSESTTAPDDSSTSVAQTSGPNTASEGGEGPLLDVGSAETGGEVASCDRDAPNLIHVLNTNNEIWTFDPITVTYAFVTAVDCPQIEGTPTGFAIDRNGLITVLSAEPFVPDFDNHSPMRLTRFAPGDVDCEEIYYGALGVDDDGFGLDCADLSLVSRVDDPDDERLFAHACTAGGFAFSKGAGKLLRLDPDDADPAFALLSFTEYTSAPLAGTGDGRLFGVSGDPEVSNSIHFLEFDQDTGALVATTPVSEINLGGAGNYFALAFYGGDLYTFGLDDVVGTVVHQYDWDDDDGNGEHEVTLIPDPVNPPFSGGIFAAASPTCIPLTPAG